MINGTLPAPLIRLREGQNVRLSVTNRLKEDTSIHWHGLIVPFQMDGVPGVSFPGIQPGETFTYEFPVRQSGTYWYHSHSGMQEAVMIGDRQTEGRRTPCDRPADPTHADNAQLLAADAVAQHAGRAPAGPCA